MKKWIGRGFMMILLGVAVCHVLIPDATVSRTERRPLLSFPTITWETVWEGTLSEQIESYLLDHFPGRDGLRQVQTLTEQYGYRMSDVNGYYQIQGGIYELAGETQEQYISYAGNGFGTVAKQYFPAANIYYAVIPDKNYFVAEANGYPTLDYERILEVMQQTLEANVPHSQYVDLFQEELLSIEDYYRTDLHWRQECIVPVAEKLASSMGANATEINVMGIDIMETDAAGADWDTQEQNGNEGLQLSDYEVKTATDSFKGSYLGASAYVAAPDVMQYLDGEALRGCKVYDYESHQNVPVYQEEKLVGVDAYDFYLGGARALLRIDNPSQKNGRTLVMFRDSFGSSIAPLLVPFYEQMILIDLRYVSMEYCAEQIAFPENADVLFLYNADMLNHGNSLRF